MGRLHGERLPAELAVEILGVLGRVIEMDHRRAAIAKFEPGAAKPIFAKRDALGARCDTAQRQEVLQRQIGIVEETQSDPAGEEFGFDKVVAGYEPVLGRDLIGDFRVSVIERATTTDPPLDPPVVQIEQNVGLARRIEQHLPGFFPVLLVLGAPQPLNAIEPQADIGLDGVGRERVEKLPGIATALDYGDTRRDLFLLIGREQLRYTQRRLSGAFVIRIEQPVDPRSVMLGRKPTAIAIENLLFDFGVELMVAPGGNDEVARTRFVVLLDIDRGKSGLASAGLRRRGAEKRLDVIGVGASEEEGGFCLLAQFVLPWPVGMGKPEVLDRLGLSARRAVPVLVPERKVTDRRVVDAGRRPWS